MNRLSRAPLASAPPPWVTTASAPFPGNLVPRSAVTDRMSSGRRSHARARARSRPRPRGCPTPGGYQVATQTPRALARGHATPGSPPRAGPTVPAKMDRQTVANAPWAWGLAFRWGHLGLGNGARWRASVGALHRPHAPEHALRCESLAPLTRWPHRVAVSPTVSRRSTRGGRCNIRGDGRRAAGRDSQRAPETSH